MSEENYSSDLQAWIEPELEARLVAMILGEASDFEKEELERLMKDRPELAIFKRRLEAVDGLVRESVKPSDDEKWKLSSPARDKVLAKIGEPSNRPPAVVSDQSVKQANFRRSLLALAACVLLLLGLFALTTPVAFKSLGKSAEATAEADREIREMEEVVAQMDDQSDGLALVEESIVTREAKLKDSEMILSRPVPQNTSSSSDFGSYAKLKENVQAGRQDFGEVAELSDLTAANQDKLFLSRRKERAVGQQIAGEFYGYSDVYDDAGLENLSRGVIPQPGQALRENFKTKPSNEELSSGSRFFEGDQKKTESLGFGVAGSVHGDMPSLQAGNEFGRVAGVTDYDASAVVEEEPASELAELDYKPAPMRRSFEGFVEYGSPVAPIMPSTPSSAPTDFSFIEDDSKPAVVAGTEVVEAETLASVSSSSKQVPAPVKKVPTERDSANFDAFSDVNDGLVRGRESLRRLSLVTEADNVLAEGRKKYAEGDYSGAVESYREALDTLPPGSETDLRRDEFSSHLADASAALSHEHRRQGRYEEASKSLGDVLLVDPENDKAQVEWDYFDHSIRTNPGQSDGPRVNVDKVRRGLYKGEGYYNLGRFDEAWEEVNSVLRVDPYNSAARRWQERINAARSDYYRAAYDETRSRMLMEVDKAWEMAVPPPIKAEGNDGSLIDILETQLELTESRLGSMQEVVSERRDGAVSTALESHDYVEAKRDYENAQEQLQKMKLQHISDRISLKIPKNPVTVHEEPSVKEKKKWFGRNLYEGKATVQVHPEIKNADGNTVFGAISPKAYMPTEVRVVESEATLGRVVDELGLDKKWKTNKKEAAKKLKDIVSVEPVKGTDLLDVKVTLKDREEAAKVTEAIVKTYVQRRQEAERHRSERALAAMDGELRDQEDLVEDKRKVLDTIVQAVGIPYVEGSNVGGIGESENSIYQMSERQLYESEREKEQLNIQLKKLLELEGEDLYKYAAGLDLPNNAVPQLYAQYKEAQRELEAIKVSGLGASHPEMKMRAIKVEQLEKDIQKSLGRGAPEKKVEKPARKPARKPAELSAKDEPFSTFSLHVSDVSFKLAQAALAKGEWPESERVRSEEFLNAFDYEDPSPRLEEKVACQVEQAVHPFAQQRNLVRVSMRTAATGRMAETPLRLTILLDNSGSMERADRAESVSRAFDLLAGQLNPQDEVTLISFARTPRLVRDRMNGEQAQKLSHLLKQIPSEGGTNLEAALQLGAEKAKEAYLAGAQNRIILMTDGAANLGNAKPDELRGMIETLREQGIAFDACGVGADGLNDEILESLTRKGDGRYYFLDRPEDADGGFAKQIAGALRPAAKNVKVQVEFNPDRVGRYKLYGFEKHELKKEDFRNDSVDAAELAAEEAGVAMYQVETLPEGEGPVGTVSVRFQDTATGQMVERTWDIPYQAQPKRLAEADSKIRLAAIASLFGEHLKGSAVGEAVDLAELARLTHSLPSLYPNQERIRHLVEMVNQARALAGE